jgi:anti-sigma factor RsiW
MSCHVKDEALSAWLMGHLPASSAEVLAAHVAQCASCARRKAALEASMAALKPNGHVTVPASLKTQILSKLKTRREKIVHHWQLWQKGLMAATVAGLLAVGVINLWPRAPWSEQKILQAYNEDFQALGYNTASDNQDSNSGLFGVPKELTAYFN